MPAIDLARLKKQTARLADFFVLPAEFLRDYARSSISMSTAHCGQTKRGPSLRTCPPIAHRPLYCAKLKMNCASVAEKPTRIMRLNWQIPYGMKAALETRLLAAFLLGRIPPQEERLLARLTAWTQAVRDPRCPRRVC